MKTLSLQYLFQKLRTRSWEIRMSMLNWKMQNLGDVVDDALAQEEEESLHLALQVVVFAGSVAVAETTINFIAKL